MQALHWPAFLSGNGKSIAKKPAAMTTAISLDGKETYHLFQNFIFPKNDKRNQ
jgi:hypothetical protein